MRAVINVATGRYVKGQERLTEELTRLKEEYFVWRDKVPPSCPSHAEVPYAFKAYAMRAAQVAGAKTLLWADACILPIQPLGPLWERIERDGYVISNQAGPGHKMAWSNYEWTADAAYPDLFRMLDMEAFRMDDVETMLGTPLEAFRKINRTIPHVVATTCGVSLEHPTGRAILDEYFRLASETKAFCGPWKNEEMKPCGPPDVRGHRHDQTALSVIAWRLGCKLTPMREVFAYRGQETESTILVADGSY